MQTVVIIVHLMVVLALIGLVMLQKSEGGGLGVGSTGGFLSSRGTANVLTRATAFLAIAFFLTSLGLDLIAGMERKPKSLLQDTATPAPTAPGPTTPLGTPGGGGLLDKLGGQGGDQPPAPPTTPPAPAPAPTPAPPQSQ
jgi:preprotein translocase subunit SecG